MPSRKFYSWNFVCGRCQPRQAKTKPRETEKWDIEKLLQLHIWKLSGHQNYWNTCFMFRIQSSVINGSNHNHLNDDIWTLCRRSYCNNLKSITSGVNNKKIYEKNINRSNRTANFCWAKLFFESMFFQQLELRNLRVNMALFPWKNNTFIQRLSVSDV